MRRSHAGAVSLAAAVLVAGVGFSITIARSSAVQPPAPPVLRAQARAVTAELESWCRPTGEHDGPQACSSATPSVGHRLPQLSALQRASITLNTRIDARTVRVDLSAPLGSRTLRTVRPRRIDDRQWRFRLPSDRVRAQIAIRYADGGTSKALILLRPTRRRC